MIFLHFKSRDSVFCYIFRAEIVISPTTKNRDSVFSTFKSRDSVFSYNLRVEIVFSLHF